MKIKVDRLQRRGVDFIFEASISKTTEGDGLNICQND
jgi:hypothetical protein